MNSWSPRMEVNIECWTQWLSKQPILIMFKFDIKYVLHDGRKRIKSIISANMCSNYIQSRSCGCLNNNYSEWILMIIIWIVIPIYLGNKTKWTLRQITNTRIQDHIDIDIFTICKTIFLILGCKWSVSLAKQFFTLIQDGSLNTGYWWGNRRHGALMIWYL